MAVMGKASIPGRAKTRLVPPLTHQDAARLNTAFLQDIVANIEAAAREVEVQPYVAYGPIGSEAFFRQHLPADVGLLESCSPNFGETLYLVIETLLARGFRSVCVVNSDSPTLPTAQLIAAARQLAEPGDRAVLGPSLDGGYYLLGLKAPHRRLFEGIAWSTASVCEQTRQRAAELALPLVLLEPWYDVDDIATLRRLHGDLSAPSAPVSAAAGYAAPHARAALAACPAVAAAVGAAAS
jgi:rSAM/selenodomain-associated transferase 1